jgi:hypothetical protein
MTLPLPVPSPGSPSVFGHVELFMTLPETEVA